MKQLLFTISFFFVLSPVFGDDVPQVYYSSSQKPEGASEAAQQASGMEQLKMKKIDDLQEMSTHHFGKLEEIQHQLIMLDQKISGLIESVKVHQEALKKIEQNQLKNQALDQAKEKSVESESKNLRSQPTVIQDDQTKKSAPLENAQEIKKPKEPSSGQINTQPVQVEEKPLLNSDDQIKKSAEMVEGAGAKKETTDEKEKPEEQGRTDKGLPKKDLLENPTQGKNVPSPEDKYKEIRALIVQGSYKQSREELIEFIEQNPDHSLLPSAYYWLGETYFVEKKFSEAAKTFMKGYKVNPSSHKVNDILLKLAMSLAALGKKQDACKTYKKLRSSEVPVSSTHKHIADREEKKLGCA